MEIKTIDSLIGNTPLVKLQRLNKSDSQILVKLEGDNPAGSVKDRAAMYMVNGAENTGLIKSGDTIKESDLIEVRPCPIDAVSPAANLVGSIIKVNINKGDYIKHEHIRSES